ncbi:MAG: CDP-diacylglycerol--glycerol-3-phosphate 3-phosphatidyltransferase, partial [Pseudomonadales bacterium]|nr:CDP-diacylglycerol--glycerol-3-phosphate 3-phosphatidyltransferase [Pseudomonadales bacterium]
GDRSVAVSFVGKLKTGFQMVAIIVLLASEPDLTHPVVILGYVLLYAAAGLTLWSMVLYLRLAWPDLSSGMKND